MKERVIGIDHGNGYMKTAHCVFKSGVDAYDSELPFQKGVLYLNDRYYVIGEHIKPYQADKTQTEEYWLLTLAAIAAEIKANNYPKKGTYILAVGLPIEFYGHQKAAFKRYIEQKKEVFFRYEGENYAINIKKADIFPQGMAAVASNKEFQKGMVNIIDVGSGTIDTMQLIDGQPVLSKCISLPLGVLTCSDEIQKYFRMNYAEEIDEYDIQNVLQGKESSLPDEYTDAMKKLIKAYTEKVLAALNQKGLNTKLTRCHFCCGGATVFEKYMEKQGKYSFDTDIQANAKGFEGLSKQLLKNQ